MRSLKESRVKRGKQRKAHKRELLKRALKKTQSVLNIVSKENQSTQMMQVKIALSV